MNIDPVTGRWLWLRMLLCAKESDRKHIFITGAARSGTTLLKTILTANSEIAGGDYESTGIFNLRDLSRYACGEIDPETMSSIIQASAHLVDFYDRVADQLLAYWGGNVFVDKIWPNRFRLKFAKAHFPKGKWVHIVRDGRDCYCSARKHPNVPQGRNLRSYARYWQKSVRLIERILPRERVHTIKYESLVSNAEEEVRRLMTFLELPFEPEQLAYHETSRIPSIRKLPHHSRLVEPLNSSSVSRYEAELESKNIEEFLNVARKSLVHLGYE